EREPHCLPLVLIEAIRLIRHAAGLVDHEQQVHLLELGLNAAPAAVAEPLELFARGHGRRFFALPTVPGVARFRAAAEGHRVSRSTTGLGGLGSRDLGGVLLKDRAARNRGENEGPKPASRAG